MTAVLLSALLLCIALLTHADTRDPTECYTRVPAGADGIGKRYIDRDLAGVLGWQGSIIGATLKRRESPMPRPNGDTPGTGARLFELCMLHIFTEDPRTGGCGWRARRSQKLISRVTLEAPSSAALPDHDRHA